MQPCERISKKCRAFSLLGASFNRRYRKAEEYVAYRLIRTVSIYHGVQSPLSTNGLLPTTRRVLSPDKPEPRITETGKQPSYASFSSFIFQSTSLFSLYTVCDAFETLMSQIEIFKAVRAVVTRTRGEENLMVEIFLIGFSLELNLCVQVNVLYMSDTNSGMIDKLVTSIENFCK